MPREEKQILWAFLIALFSLWSIYVDCFYRTVQALPAAQSFAVHESIRVCLFAAIPLCWTLSKVAHPTASIGLRFSLKATALGLAIGLAYATVAVLIGVLLQGRTFDPRLAQASFWTSGFCLATLVEELSFRSFLLGVLHFRSGAVAILTGASCFALIHVPGWWCLHLVPNGAAMATQLLAVFLLGCVLAIVFRRTRSFYAVVLIHALNNLAAAAIQ